MDRLLVTVALIALAVVVILMTHRIGSALDLAGSPNGSMLLAGRHF